MGLPLKNKMNFTYRDYLLLQDDKRYEVIEGELIMVPAPNTEHQRISRKIEFILDRHVTAKNLGEIFNAPCDVVLDDETVLQPDILFVSNDRKDIITKANINGAPDLVIEIISPSSAYYDLIKKKKIYAQFGVKEYWVIDPEEKTAEVYTLDDHEYKLQGSYKEADTLHTLLFADLSIDLSKIFT